TLVVASNAPTTGSPSPPPTRSSVGHRTSGPPGTRTASRSAATDDPSCSAATDDPEPGRDVRGVWCGGDELVVQGLRAGDRVEAPSTVADDRLVRYDGAAELVWGPSDLEPAADPEGRVHRGSPRTREREVAFGDDERSRRPVARDDVLAELQALFRH